jgi:arabinogalactan oligomer/maltooligosaccharide transport system permease protein
MKWLSSLAILVALVLFTPRARAAEHVVLWHSYRGDEERALVEIAARYQRETGVVIDLLALPFEALSAKLDAAVPHAHGPDLYIEAHERLDVYRRDGIVAR